MSARDPSHQRIGIGLTLHGGQPLGFYETRQRRGAGRLQNRRMAKLANCG
jgi:hypothetical protein